jgi:hypothetical protein
MKRKQSAFERKVLAKALGPRAANNVTNRDILTPEPVDRAALRKALRDALGNVMPDDVALDELCSDLDPLRHRFFEAQQARENANAFDDAIREAIKAGQRELAAAGPITAAVWRNGQLVARPALYRAETMDDPAARERLKLTELKVSVLKSLVDKPELRDWRSVIPELVAAVEKMLRATGCYSRGLCDQVIVCVVPLVSGERTTQGGVRKAIERMDN